MKTLHLVHFSPKLTYIMAFASLLAVAALVLSVNVNAATYIPISSQLDRGMTNANVTNLQAFLAADTALYPEGLVTGYYGPLTAAAVSRFQGRYGFEQVGRVGPLTLLKINSLIAGGQWGMATDTSGPWIYSISQSTTTNSATFSWSTNENAIAKIFYHTSPLTMNEGDINSVGFGATNGSVAVSDNIARTSHQVAIRNLQPNTLYYYTIVATDPTGNVSVWNPNGTFRTGL